MHFYILNVLKIIFIIFYYGFGCHQHAQKWITLMNKVTVIFGLYSYIYIYIHLLSQSLSYAVSVTVIILRSIRHSHYLTQYHKTFNYSHQLYKVNKKKQSNPDLYSRYARKTPLALSS